MKYGAGPRPQIREEGSHTTTRFWQNGRAQDLYQMRRAGQAYDRFERQGCQQLSLLQSSPPR
jgi:hypothetical protein